MGDEPGAHRYTTDDVYHLIKSHVRNCWGCDDDFKHCVYGPLYESEERYPAIAAAMNGEG